MSEKQVVTFERTHEVTLPRDYRDFLINLGNGGAGPFHGIEPLGMLEDRPLHPQLLDQLSLPFDPELADEREEDDEAVDVMQGTMPICTEGCSVWYRLVVTGPGAGEIWLDPRADNDPPDVVVGEDGELGFREWYENWLIECADTWLPR